jgi:nicotinamide-nucleotide amidase
MTPVSDLPADLLDLAKEVLNAARAQNKRIVTAESCTGGLLGGCLTANAGSSDVMDCGFITYSNESKSRLLGVPRDAIAGMGAVSDLVASAMAEGALAQTDADLAVSITGIAGPGGGTKEKPVGLVYMALAQTDRDAMVKRYVFAGTRSDIRRAAVGAAMELLLNSLKEEPAD